MKLIARAILLCLACAMLLSRQDGTQATAQSPTPTIPSLEKENREVEKRLDEKARIIVEQTAVLRAAAAERKPEPQRSRRALSSNAAPRRSGFSGSRRATRSSQRARTDSFQIQNTGLPSAYSQDSVALLAVGKGVKEKARGVRGVLQWIVRTWNSIFRPNRNKGNTIDSFNQSNTALTNGYQTLYHRSEPSR
jgi:hypothetical protein